MAYSTRKTGYGKRPMWQWIAVYIVIGGLVYGVIYYFAFAGKDTGYGTMDNSGIPQKQNMQEQDTQPSSEGIY